MKRINIVKTGLLTLAFAGLLSGVAAAGTQEFALTGHGPVERVIVPGTRTLIVDFRNNSNINMGADIYDSNGEHVFGRTLKDKGVVRATVATVATRVYRIVMRCNDRGLFDGGNCRAQAFWVCEKGSKHVNCSARP